jgi:hypothetical protein
VSEIETFLAQLAETERLAKEATPGPWLHVDFAEPSGQPLTASGEQSTFMGCGSVITLAENVLGGDIAAPCGDLYPRSGYSPKGDMAHIAHLDPAWVLRWVVAVREILQQYEHHLALKNAGYGGGLEAYGLWLAVRALMSVYGDREEGS